MKALGPAISRKLEGGHSKVGSRPAFVRGTVTAWVRQQESMVASFVSGPW